MKKLLGLAAILVVVTAGTAMADIGDQYLLPVKQLQGGGWNTLSGAGYNGTDAYQASGIDGVRRIYWELNNPSTPRWDVAPTTAVLYRIDWFRPTTGAAGWQPIESQVRGTAGETYPVDPLIPWAGAFGTNHQYIASENGTPGAWNATGPGPHTPDSASPVAGANGIYMWLYNGSQLYAKWDYGFSIDHAYSYLRLTQVTAAPEPGSILALGGGLLSLAGLIRRRK